MKCYALPRGKRGVAFSLLALLTTAHVALGQTSTTGAIRGTVTDPQGAVIPTGVVTVKSDSTAAVRTAMTGKNGEFTVGLLPPGTYTVTIVAPGFKTDNPGAITVTVTETVRVDAKLVLGSQSDVIDVSSLAPALQVENATLGTVVDGSVISQLPLTNRNYTQVLTMSAGISGDLNNAATLGKGSPDVYVNGASNISNNFHMDGADINNFGSGRAGDFVQQAGIPVPSPDALQEFKIQTTNYDAGAVAETAEQMKKADVTPRIMIDCSHANSNKDYTRQGLVCRNVAGQIAAGDRRIVGVMLESNLVAGAQTLVPGKPLVYGQSITDGCIDWNETRGLLAELAGAVSARG